MNLVRALPPNFDAIDVVFNIRRRNAKGVIYCYGEAIYNPDGVHVPEELLQHETVHSRQQLRDGGPEKWWDRYLSDPQWRLEQEIAAHRVEWVTFMQQGPSRQRRRGYLDFMIRRLSGETYGRLLTRSQAKKEICGDVDE